MRMAGLQALGPSFVASQAHWQRPSCLIRDDGTPSLIPCCNTVLPLVTGFCFVYKDFSHVLMCNRIWLYNSQANQLAGTLSSRRYH